MSVLRTLRKLLFGETLVLPLGVAVLLGAGLVLRAVGGDTWRHVAGPALAVAVLGLLLAAVGRVR